MRENLRILVLAMVIIVFHKHITKLVTDSFNEVNNVTATGEFIMLLDSLGIQYPDIVLAQALHETNTFRSTICKENHNLFGMKESSRHYDIGSNRGHALYPHKQHRGRCNVNCYLPSILDYRDWQKQMMPLDKIKNREDYIYYLQNLPNGMAYAEDKSYPIRLKHYLNIIDECQKPVSW